MGAYPNLLSNGVRMEFDADTTYEMTLDLGPYGDYRLEGNLFSADTILQYETLITDHFVIKYPKDYRDRYDRISELLDAGYTAMQEATGLDLVSPVEVTIYIRADWAGLTISWGYSDPDAVAVRVDGGYLAEAAIKFPLEIPNIAVRVFFTNWATCLLVARNVAMITI